MPALVNLDSLFLPAFLGAAAVWTLITGFLILRRAYQDVVTREVRRARQKVRAARNLPLEDRDSAIDAALRGLSRGALDRLASEAATPDVEAERCAAMAIHRWGDRQLLAEAGRRSSWRGPWRRITSLRILARAGHEEAISLLSQALAEADPRVVSAAVGALGTMTRPEAAALLVSALREKRFPASRIATQLEGFRVPIQDLLQPLLDDPLPQVRRWAATLLFRYPEAPGLDAALARLRNDPAPEVRKAAIQTLARVGGAVAAAAAMDLLADPVPFVRAHAARALGTLGDPSRAEHLVPLLGDRDWWVRLATKEALAALGPSCWRVVAAQLDSEDTFARNGAAEVLQNTGVLATLMREAAGGTLDEAGRTALRRAALAGGPGLLAGLLESVPPEHQAALRELAQELGFSEAAR